MRRERGRSSLSGGTQSMLSTAVDLPLIFTSKSAADRPLIGLPASSTIRASTTTREAFTRS